MNYGIYQALYNLLEEGLENSYKRHQSAHEYLVKELEKLGLELYVAKEHRLPMLNSVKVPDGMDEALVRARLLSEHAIEIGAGLGPLAGQIVRIGLMGYNAHNYNVDRLVAALKAVM
jgi:alanine-glyoxylate transaminase/serine-glyoxylate transaminase/serine-pyruvate transaminase